MLAVDRGVRRPAGVEVLDKEKGTAAVADNERCKPGVRRMEDRAEAGRCEGAWGGEDDGSADTSSALPSRLRLRRTLLFVVGACPSPPSLLKFIGNGSGAELGVASSSGQSWSPGVINPPFSPVRGVMNFA